MARPRRISDEEILAAARAVFLRRGVRATAADVAARCGVGEATIFRRFPTKHELLRAAMASESEPAWVRTLPERAGRGNARRTVKELGAEIIDYARQLLPLLLTTLSSPTADELERRSSMRLRILQALTEYFAVEVRAGRVQVRDPRVAARIFLGGLLSFVMFERIVKGNDDIPDEIFLNGLADAVCGRAHRRPNSGVVTPTRGNRT